MVNDFITFFQLHKLSVLNTWYNHKICKRYTWHSPNGLTKKVYDFILCCSWLRQYCTNCRVYNSFDFDSDHRIVIVNLNTPSCKTARYKHRKKESQKMLNLRSLNDVQTERTFVETVANKLSTLTNNELPNSQLNECFVETINRVAENTLPKQVNQKLRQPWHDDDKLRELYT